MAQSTWSLSVSGGAFLSVPLPAIGTGVDFGLSFWVWRAAGGGGFQAMFDDDTTSRHFASFHDSTGANSFAGDFFAQTDAWSNTVWHHIFLQRVSNSLNTYLDGTMIHSTGTSNSSPSLNLHFGDNPSGGGTNWSGGFDDIAFWVTSSVPNATQIAGIAAGTTDVSTLSPFGLWRVEEGGGTTLTDTSGNSHNGTQSSGSWSTSVPSQLGGSPAPTATVWLLKA